MARDHDKDQEGGTGRKPALLLQGKGKLLRLADYETARPDRILAELRGYWESLRQGRAIPARADVEPRGIRRALDYAFVLERIAPGAARFRLAGRHLIDLMGMEVRGMPVCSFMNTSSRGRLSDVLESVFRGPQIAEIRQGIKDFSDWPTIPQLYVKGEFVGGCDIVTEMTLSGELDQLFDKAGIAYDKEAADKIREANA